MSKSKADLVGTSCSSGLSAGDARPHRMMVVVAAFVFAALLAHDEAERLALGRRCRIRVFFDQVAVAHAGNAASVVVDASMASALALGRAALGCDHSAI